MGRIAACLLNRLRPDRTIRRYHRYQSRIASVRHVDANRENEYASITGTTVNFCTVSDRKSSSASSTPYERRLDSIDLILLTVAWSDVTVSSAGARVSSSLRYATDCCTDRVEPSAREDHSLRSSRIHSQTLKLSFQAIQ